MSYGKQGYEAGKGRTFTPSSNAEWVDDFNRLLEEYNENGFNISRNRLTEILIEDGLKYHQNKELYKEVEKSSNKTLQIPIEHFSDEEISILKSEQGQIILRNVLGFLLGKGQNTDFITSKANFFNTSNQSQNSDEGELKNSSLTFITDDKKENDSRNRETNNPNNLSALDKLRKKRKMLIPD